MIVPALSRPRTRNAVSSDREKLRGLVSKPGDRPPSGASGRRRARARRIGMCVSLHDRLRGRAQEADRRFVVRSEPLLSQPHHVHVRGRRIPQHEAPFPTSCVMMACSFDTRESTPTGHQRHENAITCDAFAPQGRARGSRHVEDLSVATASLGAGRIAVPNAAGSIPQRRHAADACPRERPLRFVNI